MPDTEAAVALAKELRARGLTLPDGAVDLLDRHDALQVPGGAIARNLLALEELDPITAPLDDVAEVVRRRALAAMDTSGHIELALLQVREPVRRALADLLAGHADAILDQLRPAFDKAATALHKVTQTGVRAGTLPHHVIDLGDAAVKAWRTIPGHVTVLADTARLRLTMTDALDLPPKDTNPWHLADETAPALCFTTDETTPWRDHLTESQTDQWLRLCTPRPARLLTLSETAEAHRRLLDTELEQARNDNEAARV